MKTIYSRNSTSSTKVTIACYTEQREAESGRQMKSNAIGERTGELSPPLPHVSSLSLSLSLAQPGLFPRLSISTGEPGEHETLSWD